MSEKTKILIGSIKLLGETEQKDNIKKIIIFAKENENIPVIALNSILNKITGPEIEIQTYSSKDDLPFLLGVTIYKNYNDLNNFIITDLSVLISKELMEQYHISLVDTKKEKTIRKKSIKNTNKIDNSIKINNTEIKKEEENFLEENEKKEIIKEVQKTRSKIEINPDKKINELKDELSKKLKSTGKTVDEIIKFIKKTNIRKQTLPDGYDKKNEDLAIEIMDIIEKNHTPSKIKEEITKKYSVANAEYINNAIEKFL